MAQTAPNDDLPVGSGATMPCGLWIAMVLIVVVTAAFRLPSCRESFWLDELHSAWAVSDAFSEVAPRAAIGNQTTGYFHLLWFWSAIVGSGELPMRLSSVIASCVRATPA